MIGYQGNEFTHSWLVEYFVVCTQIYPCFMDQMSTLIHFLFEWSCEDYTFLDQVVKQFEHGVYSILMKHIDTPETR